MTEIERMKDSGILPASFFREEEMKGFFVTENQKKVWAIELDLLLKVDEVCRKHDLKYFLAFGSLLGAVRHHGFIPWDDDMDICLPRRDYEKLLSLDDEFKAPYFLQTPLTDTGFYYAHAKLRNNNTTALDYPFIYQGFNQGIFIDILPLDEFDAVHGAERFDKINEMILLNSTAMRLTHPALSDRDKERVKKYPGGDPVARYLEIQSLAKKDYGSNIDTVSLLVATTYGIKRDVFLKADFEEAVRVDFSGIETNIPKGYDHVLSVTYGDYLQLPPLEIRGKWHSNLKFYPEIPYKEYLLTNHISLGGNK